MADTIPDNQRKHVLIVLDVSPSMRLKDAGPNADQSRMKRGSEVMESFFQRIPVEIYLMSVVACYNGAKPVVVDTKDLEVVRNIFGDLPMQYAFPSGKTDLFSGLSEAVKIAAPLATQEHAPPGPFRRRHGSRDRNAQAARLDCAMCWSLVSATHEPARSSMARCRGKIPALFARSPPAWAEHTMTATRNT